MDAALAGDFGVHRSGFEGLKLADAPGGMGELLDATPGVGSAGLERGVEIGAEAGEELVGGNGERRGCRGVETVADAVAGGMALAVGGDGSAGFGAVEAGSLALALCSDHGPLCMRSGRSKAVSSVGFFILWWLGGMKWR